MNLYFDNNATTRLDPRVLEAMLPELNSPFNNPSASHSFGQEAKNRLQQARDVIAKYLKSKREEILFTSGGTESMNMLIHGFLHGIATSHIITSNVEHSCVYKALLHYAQAGHEVSFLPAGLIGAVQPTDVQQAIRPSTRLIILTAANNETGVKHDINAIAAIAQQSNIPFIVDGVALMGKECFSLPQGLSGMGVSGHKFHAPKGSGFAFLRTHLRFQPLFMGGDQEYGKRSGTENLPAIIGLAKAISLLQDELPAISHRMAILRDRLEAGLLHHCNPVVVHGMGPRVPNVCNVAFPGIHGEDLLIALDMHKVAVSHGSACSSGALEPSRVLLEMGIPPPLARASLRFSLSRFTTEEEIDQCIEITSHLVEQLRSNIKPEK
jgi:cysteine desulfurase